MAMTGAGVLLAGVLPPSLRLELAAPLTFLLLLLPMLTTRAAYGAAATGGIVAVRGVRAAAGAGPARRGGRGHRGRRGLAGRHG